MNQYENHLAAIHEAGQVVAMLAAYPGPMIRYVTIVDQPIGQSGFVCADFRWDKATANPAFRKPAEEDIIEALAGPVAERFAQLKDWDAVDLEGLDLAERVISEGAADCDNGDTAIVVERLSWLMPADRAAAFAGAWGDTVELLKPRWAKVQEFARMLVEKGRIEGSDIYEWWDSEVLAGID